MRARFCLIPMLIALGLPVTTGIGQPTFGRPKAEHTRTVEVTPAQVVPDEPRKPGPIPEWREGDPERLAPSMQATPGAVYAWKTATGLRYAWSLPFGYEAGKACNVVVMLHPAGMDFRWGFGSHKRAAEGEGGFRPGDMLVAIDGPAFDPRHGPTGARYFDVSPATVGAFRETMLELSRELPAGHLYLYGSGGIDERATARLTARTEPAGAEPPAHAAHHLYSGGGAFATAFAAAFPALCDGLLVHGSGVAPGAAVNSTVPIVFLHGAKDGVTPLSLSMDAIAEYAEREHPCARLRVLRAFNDFPNPVRASEAIDFIDGMRTEDADAALARVHRMLAPKPADEFDYTAPPWYAGAYEVLARLTRADAEGAPYPAPKECTDAQRALAREWMGAIDAEAAAHAAVLQTLLRTTDLRSLPIDGGAWLGYLIAYRDDFRGVPACEAFVGSVGFDVLAAEHGGAAHELLTAWSEHAAPSDAAERYRAVIEGLPHAFLYEGLPVELVTYTRACTRKAPELGLDQSERDSFEVVTLWDQGWRDGLEAYRKKWQGWTGVALPQPVVEPSDDSK